MSLGDCGNPTCRGYDAFDVNREPGMELQRCDECADVADDDEAAVRFVRDLERGVPEALAVLERLEVEAVVAPCCRLSGERGDLVSCDEAGEHAPDADGGHYRCPECARVFREEALWE